MLWAARVLREARFDDVWRFISVEEIVRMWPLLAPRLGRRRAFWTWMLDRWRAGGREDGAVLQALTASINGIAHAMQGTG